MKTRLCAALKDDGTPCRAFPLARHPRCRHHQELYLRSRRRNRALMRPHSPTIRLGPLADRQAILRALNRVFQPLLNGSLPLDRANRLLQRIRAASDSLPR
jgi:hypothetical protein